MYTQQQLQSFNTNYESNFDSLSTDFKFSGLSLENWVKYFDISIPKDPDYKDIQELFVKIDDAYTVAHNNSMIACGIYMFTKRTLDKKISSEYVKTYNDPNKKTAMSIEHTVSINTSNEEDNVSVSKYIYDFWQSQLQLLDKKQKLIENISWSMKNSQGT